VVTAGHVLSPAAVAGAVVAAVVTAALIPPLDRWARASGRLLDRPNERSSHRAPIPRIGGVAMVIAVLGGLAVAALAGAPPIARGGALGAGALAIATMSLVDDARSLSALPKLIGHVVIGAAVAIAAGPWPLPAPLEGVPAAALVVGTFGGTLWIVGLVNAYNFMDGIDGLAGGQAVVAGAGWAIVGGVIGAPAVTALGLVIAAASGAFLPFNRPPARVFMGDTGSAFLGYAFAVMPVIAEPSARLLAAAAFLVWPFLVDTVLTFARRLRRGENVMQAHRSHLYQRLVATGLSHRQVTLTYVALAALGVPAGVSAAAGAPGLTAVLAVLVAAAAALLWRAAVRRETAGRHPARDSA
jgi:glycosyltransferase WbpL